MSEDPQMEVVDESGLSAAEAAAKRTEAAQLAAHESGAQAFDLELDPPAPGAEPAEREPEVQVQVHSGDAETGDWLVLRVDGEERARTALAEVDPELLERAKAEADPRAQAALLWPEDPDENVVDAEVVEPEAGAAPDPGEAGQALAPGDTSAAEGLAAQVAEAEQASERGTQYVIFRHGLALEKADLDSMDAQLVVKEVGGAGQELEALLPLGTGRFTGAPAALIAARERFGEGSYVAIPARNITAKTWRREQVDKWL